MDPSPKTKGLQPYPYQWNLELVGAASLPGSFETQVLNTPRQPSLHNRNDHKTNCISKELLESLPTSSSAEPCFFSCMYTDIYVTGKQELKETPSQIFVLSSTSIQNLRVRNCLAFV